MSSSSAAYTLTDCTMPLGICNWKEKIYNLVTNNFMFILLGKTSQILWKCPILP